MNLQDARRRLLDRREELRSREMRANAGLRAQPDLSTDDFADDAKERERNGILSALSRTTDAELQQVENALLRLEEGRYTTCAICGEDIDEQRLEAVPYTDRCIRCAERSESGAPPPLS